MFRITISITVLVVGSGVAVGDIVSWHASSRVLPDDPSIPAGSRFEIIGESSFVSLQPDWLNMSDTVTGIEVGIMKFDIPPIQPGDSWAYQVQLRMNAHNRDYLDWGAELGIVEEERYGKILIAKDRIGFPGTGGHSFINGVSHAMDTTDGFHVYRVVKELPQVNLFVDDFDVPVLSVAYSDLQSLASDPHIRMAATSSFGTANYDVRGFAYNLDGTVIPEPSTILLLLTALLPLVYWHRKK